MPSGIPSISSRNTGGGSFFTPDLVSEGITSASIEVAAVSTRNISNGPSYFARVAGQASFASTFSVDAVSLRNIYAGASYFPRLDTITTPNFAPVTEVFDLIAGTTMTEIGSSQTLFVGLFEDGTENKVSIPLPAGRVAQLTVESSVAASSTGDYIYTVVKEGSAQSMTISMAAGQTSASTTANQVSVASGNTFSVKIVTSASAPSAFHRYSVKYTMT